jgi:hypothetical protein
LRTLGCCPYRMATRSRSHSRRTINSGTDEPIRTRARPAGRQVFVSREFAISRR